MNVKIPFVILALCLPSGCTTPENFGTMLRPVAYVAAGTMWVWGPSSGLPLRVETGVTGIAWSRDGDSLFFSRVLHEGNGGIAASVDIFTVQAQDARQFTLLASIKDFGGLNVMDAEFGSFSVDRNGFELNLPSAIPQGPVIIPMPTHPTVELFLRADTLFIDRDFERAILAPGVTQLLVRPGG